MDNQSSSVVLIGSSIFEKMIRNGCFENFSVKANLTSPNPISLYSSEEFSTDSSYESEFDIDNKKIFTDFLNATKSDYVLINLEYVKKSFYVRNNHFLARELREGVRKLSLKGVFTRENDRIFRLGWSL